MNEFWQTVAVVTAIAFWGGLAVVALSSYLRKLFMAAIGHAKTMPVRTALAAVGMGVAIAYGGSKPEQIDYRVTFDANGGSGSMTEMTCRKDTVYKLTPCAFTPPTGRKFGGWKCEQTFTRYDDGVLFFNLSDKQDAVLTMTAIWE